MALIQRTTRRAFALQLPTLPTWSLLASLPRIWLRRVEDRHELSMMDDTRLRDIGLTRERVAREIAKPFWEA